MNPNPPTSTSAFLAYAMSGLTMLLWVACVLPAGTLVDAGVTEDLTTPLFREAWLLVPALLLLIIAPVGMVLSTTRGGRLGVLALTDAFIAGYAGMGLWLSGVPVLGALNREALPPVGTLLTSVVIRLPAILVGLLLALAVLSLIETFRILRSGPDARVAPLLKGVRLAVCTMVLITPTVLVSLGGREVASLLVPFALVAISAAGATFARAPLTLRFTASLVHLALAAHVLITLRWTLFDGDTPFATVGPIGWATLGCAAGILLLAVLQSVWLWRKRGALPRLALPPVASLS